MLITKGVYGGVTWKKCFIYFKQTNLFLEGNQFEYICSDTLRASSVPGPMNGMGP